MPSSLYIFLLREVPKPILWDFAYLLVQQPVFHVVWTHFQGRAPQHILLIFLLVTTCTCSMHSPFLFFFVIYPLDSLCLAKDSCQRICMLFWEELKPLVNKCPQYLIFTLWKPYFISLVEICSPTVWSICVHNGWPAKKPHVRLHASFCWHNFKLVSTSFAARVPHLYFLKLYLTTLVEIFSPRFVFHNGCEVYTWVCCMLWWDELKAVVNKCPN